MFNLKTLLLWQKGTFNDDFQNLALWGVFLALFYPLSGIILKKADRARHPDSTRV